MSTSNFFVDIVIDVETPDGGYFESGESILGLCNALAGTVRTQLATKMNIISSNGLALGSREHKLVSEALERIIDEAPAEKKHVFKVPPYRPTAAEMSPDATLLPRQKDTDIRILVVMIVAAEVGAGPRGEMLFRAVTELTDRASCLADPHMKVHRVDVEPGSEQDEVAVLQFMDSCITPY